MFLCAKMVKKALKRVVDKTVSLSESYLQLKSKVTEKNKTYLVFWKV